MIAVIPALLRSNEDVSRLRSLIDKLPKSTVTDCLVVSQGLRPGVLELGRASSCMVLHYSSSITKWGAIREAQRALGSRVTRVLLIDADDPYEGVSLSRFCERANESKVECLIGRRDRILLFAEDQTTPYTRLYLEVFSNSVLLRRLNWPTSLHGLRTAPDIQSGLYSLSSTAWAAADFSYVHHYGGELSLFYQATTANRSIAEQVVQSRTIASSSYNVATILKEILALPFLSGLTIGEIDEAIRFGPLFYAELMPPDALDMYADEMRKLLPCRG